MRGITRVVELQKPTYKGSKRASEAAKKAQATRKAKKLGGAGIDTPLGNYSLDQVKKPLKINFFKPTPTPKISIQPVANNLEVRDQEEMVLFTDGPTKITYSSKYRTLKITPHTIALTNK